MPTLSHAACRDPANGYIQDDTVTLTATFNVINESSSFGRSLEKGLPAGKARLKAKATTGDVFEGKFIWKVEQFTKLKVGAWLILATCMASNAAMLGRESSWNRNGAGCQAQGRCLAALSVQEVCQEGRAG